MGCMDVCRRGRALGLALACLLVCVAGHARADTYWATVAADSSWNNTANWTAGVPGSGDIACFTTSNITTTYHNGDKFVKGISYSGDADFTQNAGGGVIYVLDGGITVGGGNQTFNAQIRSRGNVMPVVNNGTGLLDFNGDFYIHRVSAGPPPVTFSGDGDFEVRRFIRRSTRSLTC